MPLSNYLSILLYATRLLFKHMLFSRIFIWYFSVVKYHLSSHIAQFHFNVPYVNTYLLKMKYIFSKMWNIQLFNFQSQQSVQNDWSIHPIVVNIPLCFMTDSINLARSLEKKNKGTQFSTNFHNKTESKEKRDKTDRTGRKEEYPDTDADWCSIVNF